MKLEELKAAFDGLSEEAKDEFLAYVTEDETAEEATEEVEETVDEQTETKEEAETKAVEEPTEETPVEEPAETPEETTSEPMAEPKADKGIEERLARIEAALAKLVEAKDPLAEKREKYGVATRPVQETHEEFTDRDIDRLLGR